MAFAQGRRRPGRQWAPAAYDERLLSSSPIPVPLRGRRPRMTGISQTRARHRLALLRLVSAQFVVMLDTSIVNVALPSIQEDLGVSHAGLAWVVNSYFLAFGGFLLVAGRLADVVGRRRMFVIGAALFTAASLLAGFAPN